MGIQYEIINSNSKGNAIVYNEYLLMDCGVTYSKLKSYLKNIKVICLTHLWLHSDHFNKKCIEKIVYNFPTIKFICREWLADELIKLNVSKKNIYVLKDRKTYDLGKFTIKPIETWHDVENTSYLINFKPNTMYYATDTCKLPNDECLKGLDLYCIESNYVTELLNKHIQECKDNNDDENKLYYLNRVKSTHLSYENCTDFLLNNMGDNSEFIRIHKSSFNYEDVD